MGFSAFPPRATEASLLAALALWTPRADAAIMHVSVPYAELLGGIDANTYVDAVDVPLANYFKAKNLPIVITIDVTDGLNRAAEAPALVSIGRSITEPAVQSLYRQYARALVTKIRPSFLGLAAETNLIREVAQPTVYAAIVQMANAAANEINALSGTKPALYVSVQADIAWGRFLHNNVYQGVERDFTDFPFMTSLGLSSYPHFTFVDPSDVPLDYYSRLRNGRSAIPLLVVEGGWTSVSSGNIQSSEEKQARYLRRHEQILDSARATAVFQLNFTDIDVGSINLPSVTPFANLGLVDVNLVPKKGLATYDSIFARPRAR